MKREKAICFFDLETTGVDKSKDRIVEISIAKLLLDGSIETKTKRINPLIPIPKEASDVHGITDEIVKDCPTFKQLAKAIYDFIQGCDIAGFNSNSFDVPFLYNELYRSGIIWDYAETSFIDVRNIFVRKEERDLTAAYKFYCGKELTNAHSAEQDVKATIEVFAEQLKCYTDLPLTIKELALFSNFDKTIVDLGGCFSIDAEGDYIFNFGKHKGKKCKSETSYILWMLEQDFLPDAIKICNKILSN